MTRPQVLSLFFLGLLLYVSTLLIRILSPFFQSIFWAGILAFVFYPVQDPLLRRFRCSPNLAAGIVTLLILLVLIPPVVMVGFLIADQAASLYEQAVQFFQQGRSAEILQRIRSTEWFLRIEAFLPSRDLLKSQILFWLPSPSEPLGSLMARQLGATARDTLMFLLNVLLAFFLLFFLLRDGQKLYAFIYELVPMTEKHKRALFTQIEDTLAAVIRGQLLTCLAQAILAGFIFWVLGLPLPVLLGAATFFAALLPGFGSAAVWLPLTIYLYAAGEVGQAVALLLLGIFGISLIDNLLRPLLIGQRTKLPYPLLFFGILGGVWAYGFIGIILAPALLSLFFVLIKIFREQYLLR